MEESKLSRLSGCSGSNHRRPSGSGGPGDAGTDLTLTTEHTHPDPALFAITARWGGGGGGGGGSLRPSCCGPASSQHTIIQTALQTDSTSLKTIVFVCGKMDKRC